MGANIAVKMVKCEGFRQAATIIADCSFEVIHSQQCEANVNYSAVKDYY